MRLITALATALTLPAAFFFFVEPTRAAPAQAEASAIRVTRATATPSQPAPSDHFTGRVRLSGNFEGDGPESPGGATVTFSPGARTDWHTHPFGQTLIVTEGVGRGRHWNGGIQ
ncbi:cupin domain-containing protein, partial [bacterium]